KQLQEIRTFTTMTRDLLALSDWLAEGGSLTWRFSQPCGSLPHVGPPGQVWGPPTCGILPHSGRPPRAGFGPRAMRQQYRAARMPEAPACGRAVRTPAFPARLASALRNLAHTRRGTREERKAWREEGGPRPGHRTGSSPVLVEPVARAVRAPLQAGARDASIDDHRRLRDAGGLAVRMV